VQRKRGSGRPATRRGYTKYVTLICFVGGRRRTPAFASARQAHFAAAPMQT
jgi:hypothetical protein